MRSNDDIRKEATKEIQEIIAAQGEAIIEEVSGAVRLYIEKKSPAECLELVQLESDGSIKEHLPMHAEKRYATALIAFIRKHKFEGFTLDSALTEPTGALVADVFSKKIEGQADAIVEKVVPLLMSNERFAEGLSESLLSYYKSPIPSSLQRRVLHLLTSKLGAMLAQTFDTTTIAAVKGSIVKVTAASISSPIAMKVTASLVVSLSAALKPILIKLLASAAFKAAIAAKIKAIVVGALLAAFAKIIGVKLGLSAGSVFIWVILPIVIGWLVYEYKNFPEKLAEKVAEGIEKDLRLSFPQTSVDLAESIVEQVMLVGAGMLAATLVDDPSFQALIAECVGEASA